MVRINVDGALAEGVEVFDQAARDRAEYLAQEGNVFLAELAGMELLEGAVASDKCWVRGGTVGEV